MITFSGGNKSLVLPSPELGDKENIDLRFVYNRMMDGTVRSYKMGQPITVLEIEIRNVNRPKVVETINFLRIIAGQTIKYQDYRQVVWEGVITNQPFESTHSAPRNNSFTIVFEGRNITQ